MSVTQTITINSNLFPENDKPNESDVAYALATLAGFPQGSSVGGIINGVYHSEINHQSVIGVHLNTINQFERDNMMELLAHHGPDFVVTRKMRYYDRQWVPTDEYLIDFDEGIISHSLLDKLEERILEEWKNIVREK